MGLVGKLANRSGINDVTEFDWQCNKPIVKSPERIGSVEILANVLKQTV
jgi:hypothetical protein